MEIVTTVKLIPLPKNVKVKVYISTTLEMSTLEYGEIIVC